MFIDFIKLVVLHLILALFWSFLVEVCSFYFFSCLSFISPNLIIKNILEIETLSQMDSDYTFRTGSSHLLAPELELGVMVLHSPRNCYSPTAELLWGHSESGCYHMPMAS